MKNVFLGPEPKVRPVVVYIHGGKFAWGSGNLSDGTVFAAYADCVFVTINYRLGVLGMNFKCLSKWRSTKRIASKIRLFLFFLTRVLDVATRYLYYFLFFLKGFLNVNPTTKPRVANYGLMDQIAALVSCNPFEIYVDWCTIPMTRIKNEENYYAGYG